MKRWCMAMAGAVWIGAGSAAASEPLSWSYESKVLGTPAGGVAPLGGPLLHVAGPFESRLGVALQVVGPLQSSWAVTFSGIAGWSSGRLDAVALDAVSWGLRYRLLDPKADLLGLELFGEAGGGLGQLKLHGELLLDRQLGPVLLAATFVGEYVFQPGIIEPALVVEAAVAASYALDLGVVLGLEVFAHQEAGGAGLGRSALYAGPSVTIARDHWSVALAVMPVLAAPREDPAQWRVRPGDELFARLQLGITH